MTTPITNSAIRSASLAAAFAGGVKRCTANLQRFENNQRPENHCRQSLAGEFQQSAPTHEQSTAIAIIRLKTPADGGQKVRRSPAFVYSAVTGDEIADERNRQRDQRLRRAHIIGCLSGFSRSQRALRRDTMPSKPRKLTPARCQRYNVPVKIGESVV